MPDNTEQSWSDALFALAEEAKEDATQYGTSERLNVQLSDLSLTLRGWAATIDPGVMRRFEAAEAARVADPVIDETPEEAALNPANWASIEQARVGLRALVRREYMARSGMRQVHLVRVIALLKMAPDERPVDYALELEAHENAAERLATLDVARDAKLDWIEGNDDLEAARAYDASAGWP